MVENGMVQILVQKAENEILTGPCGKTTIDSFDLPKVSSAFMLLLSLMLFCLIVLGFEIMWTLKKNNK